MVLQLLASGQIYIKLSASYRLALPAPLGPQVLQRVPPGLRLVQPLQQA